MISGKAHVQHACTVNHWLKGHLGTTDTVCMLKTTQNNMGLVTPMAGLKMYLLNEVLGASLTIHLLALHCKKEAGLMNCACVLCLTLPPPDL